MNRILVHSACRLTVLMLLLAAFENSAEAQSSSFTYQGKLTDGGIAANGVYDLRFSLFDGLVGGNPVGVTLVKEDITVTNGIFSVTLDFGAAAFPGADRWMEIGVRAGASTGTFTTLSPLQPIASTPYAVQSLNASNAIQLGGVPSNQYVLTTDPRLTDVNCSNPCVSSTEIVDGTIVDADISGGAGIAPAKIAGTAATLAANTFSATQTLAGGNLSLPNTTDASNGVLMLGGNRFAHRFGTSNTFLGATAGNFTMTGANNTGTGANALFSNTTGTGNTAIGSAALSGNSTGNFNTAVGYVALGSSTTGSINTALGSAALSANSTGSYNTATGESALQSNTSGVRNTANGTLALRFNTTGNYNTAVGNEAGVTSVLANANVSGSNNTFIGYLAGPGTSTPVFNATAIGANAQVSANNALVLGDASVSVGIGTSSPTQKLHVVGNYALISGAAGELAYIGGNGTGNDVQVGSLNAGVTNVALYNQSTETYMNLYANQLVVDATNLNTGSIGPGVNFSGGGEGIASNRNAGVNTYGLDFYTNFQNRMAITNLGQVGIGTTSPVQRLQVAGDIRIGVGTTGCVEDSDGSVIAGTCSSDARLKTNVRAFAPLLERLVRLQPVYFDWRADEFPEFHFGYSTSHGLIAQEVEKVLPELVTEDSKGYKAVKYGQLPLLTLQAIRELKTEADRMLEQTRSESAQLRETIRQQGEQIRQLQAEMEQIRTEIAERLSPATVR